ncbi:MAG: deoxyribodipyrimidine photo-lyase, partial [Hyphomicrobiales bacterium]|nr:deoxyribodipyrimidine photo-lyase [Hyphomicrobiales bacterium]
NPALAAAIARGGAVVPVFILDDADAWEWAPGGASRWWLEGSLAALDESLRRAGNALVLRRGPAEGVIERLVAETRADAVYWNRRYEPWAIARSERLKGALKSRGVEARSFNGALLAEPWELTNGSGEAYRVFTPFWKALRAREFGEPLPPPCSIPRPEVDPQSEALAAWRLRPSAPDWAGGLRATWTPGEAAAQARLAAFAANAAPHYADRRDEPAAAGTSRLSPHLHFGELSPRQVWRAVTHNALANGSDPAAAGAESFLSEIAWREFSYHLLFHFPHLPEEPLRREFANFPWAGDRTRLMAWRRGETGYPIVDAGMRELWSTGWMHNRARMIVASFLIKDLLLDWRSGERWFWDTLVDADLANNSASWQWVAGCGADAAPYFRIFNPALQGSKFDSTGAYVRRWVPELAKLPARFIHEPWKASASELAAAGVTLGRNYPVPVVDHGEARRRALAAYQSLS